MDQMYNLQTQYQLMAQFLDQQGPFLNEQTPALTITQCEQKREILGITPPVPHVNIDSCLNFCDARQTYVF